MDGSSQLSVSEEEAFLPKYPQKWHNSRGRKAKIVLATSITLNFILFLLLGGAIVDNIEDVILLDSTSTSSNPRLPERKTDFGGLPVQHNDRRGPYVICPTEGGPSAALAAGCHFDLLANGWVPHPCFDAEKHAYFVDGRDYYFCLDKEKAHRVTQDTLMEGTLEYPELFVSFEEHYLH
ncbi:hypothetical protein GGR57DRAFT_475998 [Xylariaceae sp. FL1272]|nr:hypothetical protein GGR57DRAFT_475998 [Xylariaceae sp. FL1272]